jgi:hypothetical protein
MTTHTRTRPVSAPAYYLGRPAGLWLAALARRPATHKSPRAGYRNGTANRGDERAI